MSLSQTYYLAHQARHKLTNEAARPVHILRKLVGHANMLDGLMMELADAEQEQERWFQQTVTRAKETSYTRTEPDSLTTTSSNDRHIQWAESIEHHVRREDSSDSSSSDSESDSTSEYDEDEDVHIRTFGVSSPRLKIIVTSEEVDDSDDSDDEALEFEDEDSDSEDLALVRTASHQPPELLPADEDSDESEDETMPPSPEQTTLELTKKQVAALEITPARKSSSSSPQPGFFDETYYLPRRTSTEVEAF